MHDVEIVDECPPGSVLVKERVGKTHYLAIVLGENRASLRVRRAHAFDP